MSPSTPGLSDAARFEADLRRLDNGIRQLKVQYDMFFAGALKRQPFELRAEVEKIIKRYANAPMQKYAQRFHLNTLISRYNSLSELWGKTIRAREEGDPRTAAAAVRAPGERLVASCRLRGPLEAGAELRRFYDRFVEAREAQGGEKRKISYEKFVRGIAAQTRALQNASGCAEIELRVVVTDRKVELKATAGR